MALSVVLDDKFANVPNAIIHVSRIADIIAVYCMYRACKCAFAARNIVLLFITLFETTIAFIAIKFVVFNALGQQVLIQFGRRIAPLLFFLPFEGDHLVAVTGAVIVFVIALAIAVLLTLSVAWYWRRGENRRHNPDV
jgi:hypothetical protein